MKKFFLTLCAIAFCAGAFANDTATMNVSAEILETLTVRVDKHAEFGRLAKGTSKNEATGLYSVKGEGGNVANIVIEMPEDRRVRMEHQSGAAIYAVADHNLHALNLVQDQYVQSRPLKFTLDVPENAVTGIYTGTVLVKARYN